MGVVLYIYSIEHTIQQLIMAKRKKQKYTTIQVSKDINEHIRSLCEEYGLTASAVTERYWLSLISSSMSGSLTL